MGDLTDPIGGAVPATRVIHWPCYGSLDGYRVTIEIAPKDLILISPLDLPGIDPDTETPLTDLLGRLFLIMQRIEGARRHGLTAPGGRSHSEHSERGKRRSVRRADRTRDLSPALRKAMGLERTA